MFFEVATFADNVEGVWMAVSPSGVVYVTSPANNVIQKVERGVVSDLTNRTRGDTDGPLSTASFHGPSGIVSDKAGNLYIADQGNHRIRKIDTSGNVTTEAGPSGPEKLRGWADDFKNVSLFCSPKAIAIHAANATLYVSEHNRIRSIPLNFVHGRDRMSVGTVAAVGIKGFADGPALIAQFNDPWGLAVTQMDDVIVADTFNHRIRHVNSFWHGHHSCRKWRALGARRWFTVRRCGRRCMLGLSDPLGWQSTRRARCWWLTEPT